MECMVAIAREALNHGNGDGSLVELFGSGTTGSKAKVRKVDCYAHT